MTAFVLVHGGSHGAWCWELVAERLGALGHYVDAIDLPGRDSDADEAASIDLESWVTRLEAAVLAAPDRPVIVAHSMGGVPTTAFTARQPSAVAGVVFVSAVVPLDGATGLGTLAEAGPSCRLLAADAITFSENGALATVSESAARAAFFNRCRPEAVEAAIARLCPEVAVPLLTPVPVAEGFGTVPKVYIGATDDRTVPPALQRVISDRCGAAFVPIDADHSPFFSSVDQLVDMISASFTGSKDLG